MESLVQDDVAILSRSCGVANIYVSQWQSRILLWILDMNVLNEVYVSEKLILNTPNH